MKQETSLTMSTVQISGHWTGEGLNFQATDTRGNEIKMGREGVSAAQMVLMGLAGCMGMDIVSILQKKRQTITDVAVQVTAQQPDDYPKPYQNIEVAFTVKGDNVDSKAVARAIQLSMEKYCIVGQTLQNKIELTTSFTIE